MRCATRLLAAVALTVGVQAKEGYITLDPPGSIAVALHSRCSGVELELYTTGCPHRQIQNIRPVAMSVRAPAHGSS